MPDIATVTAPLVPVRDLATYTGSYDDSVRILVTVDNLTTNMMPYSALAHAFVTTASVPAGVGVAGQEGQLAISPEAVYTYTNGAWGASPRYKSNWSDLTDTTRFLLVDRDSQGLSAVEKANGRTNLGITVASATTAGLAKAGAGLTAASDGTLSVNQATPTQAGSVFIDSTDEANQSRSAVSLTFLNSQLASLREYVDGRQIPIASTTQVGGVSASNTVNVSPEGVATVPDATTASLGVVYLSNGSRSDGRGVVTGAQAASIAEEVVSTLVVNASSTQAGIVRVGDGLDVTEYGLLSVKKATPRTTITSTDGAYGTVLPTSSITGDDDAASETMVPTVNAVRTYVRDQLSGEGDDITIFPSMLPVAGTTPATRGAVYGSSTVTVEADGRLSVHVASGNEQTLRPGLIKATSVPGQAGAGNHDTAITPAYLASWKVNATADQSNFGFVKTVVAAADNTVEKKATVPTVNKVASMVAGVQSNVDTLQDYVDSLVGYSQDSALVPTMSTSQRGVAQLWSYGALSDDNLVDRIPLTVKDGFLYINASDIPGGSGGGSASSSTVYYNNFKEVVTGGDAYLSVKYDATVVLGNGTAYFGAPADMMTTDSAGVHHYDGVSLDSSRLAVGNVGFTGNDGNRSYAEIIAGNDSVSGRRDTEFPFIVRSAYRTSDGASLSQKIQTVVTPDTLAVTAGHFTSAPRIVAHIDNNGFSTLGVTDIDGSECVLASSTLVMAGNDGFNCSLSTSTLAVNGTGSDSYTYAFPPDPETAIQSRSNVVVTGATVSTVGRRYFVPLDATEVKASYEDSYVRMKADESLPTLKLYAQGGDALTVYPGGIQAAGADDSNIYGDYVFGYDKAAITAIADPVTSYGDNVVTVAMLKTIGAKYFAPIGSTGSGSGSGSGSGTQVVVDQTYNAYSTNPQSGIAVAQALQTISTGGGSTGGSIENIELTSTKTVVGVGASVHPTAASTTSIGANAYAHATSATAVGNGAAAMGSHSTSLGNQAGANGSHSTAIGNQAIANGYATALGYHAGAGAYATALGYYATANGYNATALGYNASASGTHSTAIGNYAAASYYATAIGNGAKATATNAIQLGEGTNSSTGTFQVYSYQLLDASGKIPADRLPVGSGGGGGSIEGIELTEEKTVVGVGATANGPAIALGYGASANGAATAVGYEATASHAHTTAIGNGASASNVYATALGDGASASGGYSIALGCNAFANDYAIQLGQGRNETNSTFQVYNYQLLDANGKIPADRLPAGIGTGGTGGSIEGLTLTSQTTIAGIGADTSNASKAVAVGTYAKATGSSSVALGDHATADGWHSTALGSGASADGHEAIAVGHGAVVSASCAIQLGLGDNRTDNLFQVWNFPLLDYSSGKIPIERLPDNYNGGSSGGTSSFENAVLVDSATGAIVGGVETSTFGADIIAIGTSTRIWREVEITTEDSEGNKSTSVEIVGCHDTIAIGSRAAAMEDGAIQIGQGTNSEAYTLQVYDYLLLDDNGNIPTARLHVNDYYDISSPNPINAKAIQIALANVNARIDALNESQSSSSTTTPGTGGGSGSGSSTTCYVKLGPKNGAIACDEATAVADAEYATAYGDHASARGEKATAIGASATAPGAHSTAVGASAAALDVNGSAFGYQATAANVHATAVGYLAQSSSYGTSVGASASASELHATAIGFGASCGEEKSTAIGSHSLAGEKGAVAVGFDANADLEHTTAVGAGSRAVGSYSTAVGHHATASIHATAMGSASKGGARGTCLGAEADAKVDAVAAGYKAEATLNAVAAGSEAKAIASRSLALGAYAIASGMKSVQLGSGQNSRGNSLQVFDWLLLADGKIPNERLDVDLNYSPTSEKPQSGRAVAQAVQAAGGGTGGSIENIELTEEKTVVGVGASAVDASTVALGADAIASASWAVAVGMGALAAHHSTAVGAYANAAYSNTVAIGYRATTQKWGAIAIGVGATADEGSICIGESKAEEYSAALGYLVSASSYAVAIGHRTTASYHGTVVGINSKAGSTDTIAIGYKAEAVAEGAIQLGKGNNSSTNTLQVWDYPLLDANGKIPADRLPVGSGGSLDGIELTEQKTVVGLHAGASNNHGTAVGVHSTAGELATGIGHATHAADNAVSVGGKAEASSYAVAIGRASEASSFSVAVGWEASARDDYGTALGTGAKVSFGGSAVGRHSTALNGGTAIGGFAKTEAAHTTAIGANAQALWTYSTAIGSDVKTVCAGSVAFKASSTMAVHLWIDDSSSVWLGTASKDGETKYKKINLTTALASAWQDWT